MNLEFYPAEKFKQEVRRVIQRHLSGEKYRVFVFGSRVRGDNFPRADIDLGIEGAHELSPRVKMAIEEELELIPTLYKIDLVDFARVAPSFKQEALKYIEYV